MEQIEVVLEKDTVERSLRKMHAQLPDKCLNSSRKLSFSAAADTPAPQLPSCIQILSQFDSCLCLAVLTLSGCQPTVLPRDTSSDWLSSELSSSFQTCHDASGVFWPAQSTHGQTEKAVGGVAGGRGCQGPLSPGLSWNPAWSMCSMFMLNMITGSLCEEHMRWFGHNIYTELDHILAMRSKGEVREMRKVAEVKKALKIQLSIFPGNIFSGTTFCSFQPTSLRRLLRNSTSPWWRGWWTWTRRRWPLPSLVWSNVSTGGFLEKIVIIRWQ